jgi:hypothetical protein
MKRIASMFLAGLALALAGCHFEAAGPEISENRIVEAAGVDSAEVRIDMGAGELRLDGGSAKLLDADFRYAGQSAKPVVKYDVAAKRGYLTVREPPVEGIGSHGRNIWEVHLSDRIPLDVRVHLGAGQGTLKLSGALVRRLDVSVGAGELKLDLTGPWDKDLDAHITGGVGQVTVRLPRAVGVYVKANGGIGGISAQGLQQGGSYYFNDAFGKSNVSLRLDVSGGIGQINLIG